MGNPGPCQLWVRAYAVRSGYNFRAPSPGVTQTTEGEDMKFVVYRYEFWRSEAHIEVSSEAEVREKCRKDKLGSLFMDRVFLGVDDRQPMWIEEE